MDKHPRVIRVRLRLRGLHQDLALFNLAVASKLRASDLVKLRVLDVSPGGLVSARAIVVQRKTQRPVQFEITEKTREALSIWIRSAGLRPSGFLFRDPVPREHAGGRRR